MANRKFGFASTAQDVLEGIDLAGKSVVITGATSGIGAESARALASCGAQILIGCRNPEKGESVAEQIRAAHPGAKLEIQHLDLLSLKSVHDFATRAADRLSSIDVLLNNAGVMAAPLSRTEQGWESQFATNHIGHFLLTKLLGDGLKAGNGARVVNVSSAAHINNPIDFDDIHFNKRSYDKWQAYGQSKTANVLYAVALDERMKDQNVRAFSLHPGLILTELGRHMPGEEQKATYDRVAQWAGGVKSVEQGAATSVWAATAPALEGRGALYLEDAQVARSVGTPGATTGLSPHAIDHDAADRLWTLTEEMLA